MCKCLCEAKEKHTKARAQDAQYDGRLAAEAIAKHTPRHRGTELCATERSGEKPRMVAQLRASVAEVLHHECQEREKHDNYRNG
jgi:hypothetical protein